MVVEEESCWAALVVRLLRTYTPIVPLTSSLDISKHPRRIAPCAEAGGVTAGARIRLQLGGVGGKQTTGAYSCGAQSTCQAGTLRKNGTRMGMSSAGGDGSATPRFRERPDPRYDLEGVPR